MERLTRLFLLLTIIGPLHMAEQLTTNIEEFYAIRRGVGRFYTYFDPANADFVTVTLITIVWTVCSLMLYVVLKGGTSRLVLLGVFGVFGASEVHHIIESMMKGGYDAGAITCVPYAIVGGMMVAEVWRQWSRRDSPMLIVESSVA